MPPTWRALKRPLKALLQSCLRSVSMHFYKEAAAKVTEMMAHLLTSTAIVMVTHSI